MSEFDNQLLHKYKVGDTFMHNGVEVKIVELLDSEFRGQPMYMTQGGNDKPYQTCEGFIDSCMGRKYGVSYIASAPDEFRVGDKVEVVDKKDDLYKQQGIVIDVQEESDIYVKFHTSKYVKYKLSQLRKLPYTLSFQEESDNVKAFKAVMDEMVATYRAKDATYGNAYQDGFNRFGAVQLVSRMYEKYCRIENLLVRNADNKVPDESVIDTITDLGVQCVVLRMLLQKNDFNNVV